MRQQYLTTGLFILLLSLWPLPVFARHVSFDEHCHVIHITPLTPGVVRKQIHCDYLFNQKQIK